MVKAKVKPAKAKTKIAEKLLGAGYESATE